MNDSIGPSVDIVTVIGQGMLMPLLTMWHEISGHAAACAAQGGHVATIGAFYVSCTGLAQAPQIVVACAGVLVNAALALIAFAAWRRAEHDGARLALWLMWVSEAFVASGYFCFSGITGYGDLGTGAGGSLNALPMPGAIRVAEIAVGIASYILLVCAAIRTLDAMLGNGPETRTARRRVAHGYYATAGLGAVLVGLLNPVGLTITLMSAAASSFGGLAGFISIGFANRPKGVARAFRVERGWVVLGVGAAMLLAFAVVLGPSLHF